MFIMTNGMLGVIILSLGILGVVIALLITHRGRHLAAMALSIFLILLGLYYSVGTTLRQYRTARKIAKIQERNRLTLEAIQSRLRETPAPAVVRSTATPRAAVARSTTTTASPAPRRRPARPR